MLSAQSPMPSEEDLRILRCPVTYQPVYAIGTEKLNQLNGTIRERLLSYLNGDLVEEELEAALINSEGTVAYRCRKGVLVMIPSLAIRLSDAIDHNALALRDEKQIVQLFYQEVGWISSPEGKYRDTEIFVDQRPISLEYLRHCHLRLNYYLPKSGRYFLDAASGAIPHNEYLTYSEHFEKRICVDLSYQALEEAQRKLGDRGIYILGDVVHLPLQDNSLDAAVSLHTIYHVPADEQRAAFDELHRVIKPSAKAVIVYTFGQKVLLVRAASAPFKVMSIARKTATNLRRLISRSGSAGPGGGKPSGMKKEDRGLYYHPHPYSWFANQRWDYPLEIYCWRSIGKQTLQQWFRPRLFGKQLLQALFFLEGRLPRLMGRWGQYPLIVIHKRAKTTE